MVLADIEKNGDMRLFIYPESRGESLQMILCLIPSREAHLNIRFKTNSASAFLNWIWKRNHRQGLLDDDYAFRAYF